MCAVCEVIPYRQKKTKTRKRKGLIILSVLIFIFVLAYLHIIFNIDPIIIKSTEQQIRVKMSSAVNTAAANVFDNKYVYGDFSEVERDKDGNITLIQTNIILVNYVARNLVVEMQKNLLETLDDSFSVPLGAFTGLNMFAGMGGRVTINVSSIGAVSYKHLNDFSSSGINQTLHRILVEVDADVELILPGGKKNVRTQTQYVLAQNLIVGKIPQIYLN